mmetsp:Transcript_28710/g.89558  ORF Transcript_28710/g.89558 Transcript_28710/m.89558 type:complete len:228 (-) Transcript_28710:861-1544(-)
MRGTTARVTSSRKSSLRRHAVPWTRRTSSAMRRGSSLWSMPRTSLSTALRLSGEDSAAASRLLRASHCPPAAPELPPWSAPAAAPLELAAAAPPPPTRGCAAGAGAPRAMPTRPRAALSWACWRMPSTEEESFLFVSGAAGLASARACGPSGRAWGSEAVATAAAGAGADAGADNAGGAVSETAAGDASSCAVTSGAAGNSGSSGINAWAGPLSAAAGCVTNAACSC